ncbi:uncharacterized protein LOC115629816 [Scaptodrosophila lebanonensis]|uniref:Uncharacterized protein LOC115629816 n=1 Tax=Drosophila lebanonensis TaxID=7225 RepID=A0A6J2U1K8_DROLE|nr:uncharacterized protein LOC115629816 [Scaptodrosophila lebanonensis]
MLEKISSASDSLQQQLQQEEVEEVEVIPALKIDPKVELMIGSKIECSLIANQMVANESLFASETLAKLEKEVLAINETKSVEISTVFNSVDQQTKVKSNLEQLEVQEGGGDKVVPEVKESQIVESTEKAATTQNRSASLVHLSSHRILSPQDSYPANDAGQCKPDGCNPEEQKKICEN